MSYNREGRAGAPKTLLGNWYEEYASRDGAAVAPPRELHFNTTNHDDFVKPTCVLADLGFFFFCCC
jgi:hypothetical protein